VIRVVDLAGSPRELGRAHGEEMRSEIEQGLERWLDVVGAATHVPSHEYIPSFLEATDFFGAIDRFTPGLLEEVRGIADGARLPFDTVFAYQLMDEEWWYRLSRMRARKAIEACSAVGVISDDQSTLLAQNMDLPSHYDGTQVLLRVKAADQPEVLIFGPAGLLGTTGLNERGVGVCVNTLPQLRHSPIGLPVGFLVRGVLAQHSLDDAAALVRRVPHASGQNYMLGGPGALLDLEGSAGAVTEVKRTGAQSIHTNHPLASEDLDENAQPERRSTSPARLQKLDAMASAGAGLSVDQIQETLSDKQAPVCVSRGSDWITLGSLVMELSKEPVLHIAPGPPAETAYTTVTF
jgi:isopenicillin-N N-acyltransferase-like protein